MKKYSTISKCRLCGGKKLSKLFSLGNLFISTFVEKKGQNIGKAPLELVWCDRCTLVQLRHTAPQELMYSGNYWYESALSRVITDDLQDIVRQAIKITRAKFGDAWLDIGANDGTLLSFVPNNIIRIGVEPAKNLQVKLKKHCDMVVKKMWEDCKTGPDDVKAKVITAIGMFYDSDNPNIFISKVRDSLAKNGLFIAQMMTGKSMLEKNDLGNICHEHLEYYSYKSLVYLFESNGLEIFKVEENTINGGSYRLYARHYRTGSISHRESITKRDYLAFYARLQKNKRDCLAFVKKQIKAGKKIYGYGASTKFNTILQWYGLGPKEIISIAEIHPDKLGKLTVGTNIPITLEEVTKQHADYLLVGPYAFKDGFVTKNRAWIIGGGRLVFCTPKFDIWPNKK